MSHKVKSNGTVKELATLSETLKVGRKGGTWTALNGTRRDATCNVRLPSGTTKVDAVIAQFTAGYCSSVGCGVIGWRVDGAGGSTPWLVVTLVIETSRTDEPNVNLEIVYFYH